MKISEWCKKIRSEKGWSIEQLANHAGVEVGTIRRWEAGKNARLSKVGEVAGRLDVPMPERFARQAAGIDDAPENSGEVLADHQTLDGLMNAVIVSNLREVARDAQMDFILATAEKEPKVAEIMMRVMRDKSKSFSGIG